MKIIGIIIFCLVILSAVACGSLDILPAVTPTPTKMPVPTATALPTATPTPTLTPTPDIWNLNRFPEYEQVIGLLGKLYGEVIVLDVALQPGDSIFIVFGTLRGEVLVAEIAVVDGTWRVLRVYPLEPEPTPKPGRHLYEGTS